MSTNHHVRMSYSNSILFVMLILIKYLTSNSDLMFLSTIKSITYNLQEYFLMVKYANIVWFRKYLLNCLLFKFLNCFNQKKNFFPKISWVWQIAGYIVYKRLKFNCNVAYSSLNTDSYLFLNLRLVFNTKNDFFVKI